MCLDALPGLGGWFIYLLLYGVGLAPRPGSYLPCVAYYVKAVFIVRRPSYCAASHQRPARYLHYIGYFVAGTFFKAHFKVHCATVCVFHFYGEVPFFCFVYFTHCFCALPGLGGLGYYYFYCFTWNDLVISLLRPFFYLQNYKKYPIYARMY